MVVPPSFLRVKVQHCGDLQEHGTGGELCVAIMILVSQQIQRVDPQVNSSLGPQWYLTMILAAGGIS